MILNGVAEGLYLNFWEGCVWLVKAYCKIAIKECIIFVCILIKKMDFKILGIANWYERILNILNFNDMIKGSSWEKRDGNLRYSRMTWTM